MVCSKFWEFEQKVYNFTRKYTMVDRPKNYLKMALKSGIFAEKRTIYNCVFDGKCRKKGVYTNVFWWKISKNNVDSMVVKMLSLFFSKYTYSHGHFFPKNWSNFSWDFDHKVKKIPMKKTIKKNRPNLLQTIRAYSHNIDDFFMTFLLRITAIMSAQKTLK